MENVFIGIPLLFGIWLAGKEVKNMVRQSYCEKSCCQKCLYCCPIPKKYYCEKRAD